MALLGDGGRLPVRGSGGHDAGAVLGARSPYFQRPSEGDERAGPLPAGDQTRSSLFQSFFQVLGMSAGICIMLLIALFEHDLKEAIGGGAHFH